MLQSEKDREITCRNVDLVKIVQFKKDAILRSPVHTWKVKKPIASTPGSHTPVNIYGLANFPLEIINLTTFSSFQNEMSLNQPIHRSLPQSIRAVIPIGISLSSIENDARDAVVASTFIIFFFLPVEIYCTAAKVKSTLELIDLTYFQNWVICVWLGEHSTQHGHSWA